MLRAQIAFVSTHGSDAAAMLLEAARRLAPLSPTLAYETYLEALSAAMFAGRLAGAGRKRTRRGAGREGRTAGRPSSAAPSCCSTGSRRFSARATRLPSRSCAGRRTRSTPAACPLNEQLRWKWLATVSSVHLWDDARWEAISERHVQIARETGALGELPLALSQRVYAHLFAGELTTAASLVDEIRAATEATGSNLDAVRRRGLAALRGREAEAISLIDESRSDVTRRGEGIGLVGARLG